MARRAEPAVGLIEPLPPPKRFAALAVTAAVTAGLVGLGQATPISAAAGGGALVAGATILLGPAGGALATVAAAAMARVELRWLWADVGALAIGGLAQTLWIGLALHRLAGARARIAEADGQLVDLKQTEARFRGLLEGAPDAIVICDADARIVQLNTEAERLFGYPRDALIGQSLDILMPERFRGRHERSVGRYLVRPSTRRMGDGADMFGRRRDGSEFPIETNLSLLSDQGEGLVTSVIRDLTPRREIQEREALLIRELNHRVKNVLASVQSIVTQTLKSTPESKAFKAAVTARLMALSQSHDVLTRSEWAGARIAEIVAEQLSPYTTDGAPFEVSGPDVTLRPNRAVTLGMAVGELATNAAKFGALAAGGSVTVQWRLGGKPGARTVSITWRERGGPQTQKPEREGFGTRLIKRSLVAGLHGEARLDYAPEGLTALLSFPLLEEEG